MDRRNARREPDETAEYRRRHPPEFQAKLGPIRIPSEISPTHRKRPGTASTPWPATFTHLANSTQFTLPRNATEGIPYSTWCATP